MPRAVIRDSTTSESSSTVASQASGARRPREVDADSLGDDNAGGPKKKRKGKSEGALVQNEEVVAPEEPQKMTSTPDLKNKDDSPPAAAATASGSHMYPRKVSSYWARSLRAESTSLHPLIVIPGGFEEQDHAPMLILTRTPLPSPKSFTIFNMGFKGTADLAQTEPFKLTREQLEVLKAYTLRVSRMLTNKPLVLSIEKMPYFFAPLSLSFKVTPGSHRIPSQKYIQWDLAKLAGEKFMIPVVPEGEATDDIEARVQDAVIQDRWIEFTNRFFAVKVRRDLTPMSKADDNPRGEGYANFVDYIKDHRKDFDGLKDYDQPMIEVSLVHSGLNYLTPIAKTPVLTSKLPVRYLVPELCVKSTVPASTFRTALLLPSILRRIEDQLVAKELNETLLDNAVSEDLLLAALSPPSACAEFDYQRLEFLGDTFLKYVVSTYCYATLPPNSEGVLHYARQHFVSNKALLKGAVDAGLPPYIQSKAFAAKLWTPLVAEEAKSSVITSVGGSSSQQNQAVEGAEGVKRSKRKKQREEQNVQWLGDKTIADVVEAIIGAAYETAGRELALSVTKTLTGTMKEVGQWSNFARYQNASGSSPSPFSAFPLGTQTAIEKIVGVRFKKPFFLAEALTHPSLSSQHKYLYERLEFLGDAVLDFLAVRYAYYRNPKLGPGALTLLKGAMVSNQALATICVNCGLYKHLQHASGDLERAIVAFARELRQKHDKEHELAEKEGREPRQYWAELDPPKALSDIVESTIGALYISDNFSETGLETFFNNVLKPFYDKYIRLQTLSHHPNKILFELFDRAGCQDHRLEKTVEGDKIQCDVVVHDVILANATNSSTTKAVRAASLCAIDALEGDSDFMARTCDCRTKQLSKKAQQNRQVELGYEEEPERA